MTIRANLNNHGVISQFRIIPLNTVHQQRPTASVFPRFIQPLQALATYLETPSFGVRLFVMPGQA
jgi:hypothetical protein